ncbi:hypothetical protein [Alteromonas sp. CYL-A6]|uniref:hypothetical protein n=1 Tax=Alteromonas nitratireducens TaxID=3390813 RepID=UPI0034B02FE2
MVKNLALLVVISGSHSLLLFLFGAAEIHALIIITMTTSICMVTFYLFMAKKQVATDSKAKSLHIFD